MPTNAAKTGSYTFAKHERITSRKIFERLFFGHQWCYAFPFKCYFEAISQEEGGHHCHAVAVSVPKRLLKKAVNRNRVKRIFRDVYRKQKHILPVPLPPDALPAYWHLLFVFVTKELQPYAVIEKGVKDCLHKISTSGKVLTDTNPHPDIEQ
ncbi:MAG: ribonuclease P protein component [Bacteroidales bacterium]|jgi:ribonuclease P protein component|nr:ribonuclease P protein component [Bacteroidales bacterium]